MFRKFMDKLTGKKRHELPPEQGEANPLEEIAQAVAVAPVPTRRQVTTKKGKIKIKVHLPMQGAKATKKYHTPHRFHVYRGPGRKSAGRRAWENGTLATAPTPAKRIGTRKRDIKLAAFHKRQAERREAQLATTG